MFWAWTRISSSNTSLLCHCSTSKGLIRNQLPQIFQYEKTLLLRCIHHFELDLIYNMDHLRIWGTEPSEVFISQTKYFKKLKFRDIKILFYKILEVMDSSPLKRVIIITITFTSKHHLCHNLCNWKREGDIWHNHITSTAKQQTVHNQSNSRVHKHSTS